MRCRELRSETVTGIALHQQWFLVIVYEKQHWQLGTYRCFDETITKIHTHVFLYHTIQGFFRLWIF